MVKQHKKEVETLEFKLVLHQKWLSESDKMEFNVENTDIFKVSFYCLIKLILVCLHVTWRTRRLVGQLVNKLESN